ncbi:hypothetical protein [Argonema galeatum]|uniref:hypothetical protein n=1 Tax=Argonema galeatum TaxID=2942762 RepID=UPI002011DBAD|nr:hypothetical protein [Argonema galeatum]MCL1464418.1 hypothetical protein [Argonema galeatum A003/A1]
MTLNKEVRQLSLNDLHCLLKLEEQTGRFFTELLSLEEPSIEFEQQEILKIRNDFRRYLAVGSETYLRNAVSSRNRVSYSPDNFSKVKSTPELCHQA